MIVEIRKVEQLLATEYDNPDLSGIKKYFSGYSIGYEGEKGAAEQSYIKENIHIVIDFYRRFCDRIEAMMARCPEYDLISFMGP